MTRGFSPLRDVPALVWLGLAVLVSLVHPFLPASQWLMVHLVVLGALTHSIMVWSAHFTQALLKDRQSPRAAAARTWRVAMLLVGTVLVLIGVPARWWPVTLAGAVTVGTAVGWHGVSLVRRLRSALPGRFRITIRYYVAATACLPIGAAFGATLARGLDDELRARMLVAHTTTMVLGWVGLTVTGTLVTLWPTMLRTRMDDRAEALARGGLPAFAVSLLLAAGGAALGLRWVAVAGLAGYLIALGWWARALWRPARNRPPHSVETWSAAAALAWLAVAVAWVAVLVATGPGWVEVADRYRAPVAVIVVGFGGQLLLGVLAYLIPTVAGGGPAVVRAAHARTQRWGLGRIVLVNGGLLLCLLPVPSAVRVVCSVVVLLALAAALPLLLLAVRAGAVARRTTLEPGRSVPDAAGGGPGGAGAAGAGAAGAAGAAEPRRSGQLIAALGILALAVTLGVGVDPAAAGLTGSGAGGSAAGVANVVPTGRVTTVQVEGRDMRFTPATVTVAPGDALRIELTNTDPTTTHDLVLATGARTERLRPGQSATLDAGVIGSDVDGWCSLVGHRQMGMTFTIRVEGNGAAGPPVAAQAQGNQGNQGNHGDHGTGHPASGAGSDPGAAAPVDFHADFGADFTPIDPVLPPLGTERTHRVTLRVTEVPLEVAPGVWQRRWTFGGRAPGPTLHGRVGDVFEVTLVNDGSMGHSIDFHAGALAPDRPMRTIPPGESLTYRFTATRSGIWMYHCATMPMSAHIAAGMHGAVVIEPPGLPAVDRSYLLVQSEVYLGAGRSREDAAEVDAAKVSAERPDAVVFNGIANQYDHAPFAARVGERVRFWLLAAGPNRPTSFHVVGGQFDSVYLEGRWLLRQGRAVGDTADRGNSAGSQALALAPAQGGFVELVFPEAGHYPAVSHLMVDAERGAHGVVRVIR